MKEYRIGDFARKVGVSPDFLKYQERFGVLDPLQTDTNYRYYRFPQASRVYASIALQNLGFPLKEIGPLLNERSFESVVSSLEEQADSLRLQARRLAILSESVDEISRFARRATPEGTWYVEDIPDFAFFAHARGDDFIEDDRLPSLQSAWVEWLPAVAPCRRIALEGCDDTADSARTSQPAAWGFMVALDRAESAGLPLEPPVEIVQGGRCLVACQSIGLNMDGRSSKLAPEAVVAFPRRVLATSGLRAKGAMYQRILPYSHEDGAGRHLNSVFYVPLA